ncbi:DUF2062 domain-containing protein [Halobaculum sp. MBLA0143]|uniref:DUF2062 domain-containing protein n=1 Tax=Halobaculum sp. MBLA0143 TaxID=3079933 RepID=UPI0035232D55
MLSRWAAVRARLAAVRGRASAGLAQAVAADHTPHQIAATFALGTVVAVLPTAGAALVLFGAVAVFVDRASKLALAAVLVVYSPPVKFALYGVSYWLGTTLLGPAPGVSPSPDALASLSPSVGRAVLVRHLLGNASVAVGLAVVGYAVVRLAVVGYRRRRDTTTVAVTDGDAPGAGRAGGDAGAHEE